MQRRIRDRGLERLRHALRRAEDGKALDATEAEVLLHSRGPDLDRLCVVASRIRDAGLLAAGRPATVTYSRKVFIPLTRLCRDRCHYCTFATTPGRLPSPYLSPDEVVEIARRGAAQGCKEALFTLGDAPEDRWSAAREWLDAHGFDSTLGYVRAMAIRVLEETGLLPHLNPGVMTWQDLQRLKPVAPSMGMMLETTADVPAHRGSPDKVPAVRLRVIEDAGRSNVAFTTGILVGIGETPADRVESLFALRRLARQYRHIQEVIVQNFRAKPDTAMRAADDLDLETYLATVAVARLVLGPKVRIQAPPNLVDLDECRRLLAAGVDDWGGVSPVTPDHVNPERPWPHLDDLARVSAESGYVLTERLTAHPPYLTEPWLDPRLRPHVEALRDDRGLAREGVKPAGLPWQEPDGGWSDAGRTDLFAAIDTEGRREATRSDFDDGLRRLGRGRGQRRGAAPRQRCRLSRPAATGWVRSSPPRCGMPRPTRRGLSDADALTLFEALPGAEIDALARARRRPAPRRGRGHRHLRREPQHQLHQRLLRRLPVLRVRPAAHRRRRLHALPRRGRRPRR